MRYFLIDKVTELVPGERASAVKNVTLTDEVLHDHFPDFPVMPGALMLEAVAQLAGLLVESTVHARERAGGAPPRRALLASIEKAKFHETAGPGDQIVIDVRLGSELAGAAQVEALLRVGERRIATARLTFVLKEIASERVHAQRRYIYELWTRDLSPRPELP